ncbi:MAG: hypothetical protein KKB21_01300 [Nanoarchaeota archaeon]|nr:hypothetical protein [Nanoarchaeota archaeon]MBU4086192.1 hypothetical protein [Nanoarchaeota archaeon]
MENQTSLESMLRKDEQLRRDISMLLIALKERKANVLCYCASTSELYDECCAHLAEQLEIPQEAIFRVNFSPEKGKDGRNALGRYLQNNITSIERARGNIAFIQSKGFAELVSETPEDDRYILSRWGHDYDQMATEDFYRNLGRRPSKTIFVLTHLDKGHQMYQRAIKTAAGSQFKLFILEI